MSKGKVKLLIEDEISSANDTEEDSSKATKKKKHSFHMKDMMPHLSAPSLDPLSKMLQIHATKKEKKVYDKNGNMIESVSSEQIVEKVGITEETEIRSSFDSKDSHSFNIRNLITPPHLPNFLSSAKHQQKDSEVTVTVSENDDYHSVSAHRSILTSSQGVQIKEEKVEKTNEKVSISEETTFLSNPFKVLIPPFMRSTSKISPDDPHSESKCIQELPPQETNLWLFCATMLAVGWVLIEDFGILLHALKHKVTGECLSNGISPTVVSSFLNLQTVIVFIFCLLISHRLLAVVAGCVLRTLLKTTSTGGAYNIHVEWISIRTGLDHTEVAIHNLVWYNPYKYTQTPYVLRCKHLQLSLDPMLLYKTIMYGSALTFDVAVIDTLEIFFEKPPRESGNNKFESDQAVNDKASLNVFKAINLANTLDEERKLIGAFINFVITKIQTRLLHSMNPFKKSKDPYVRIIEKDDEDNKFDQNSQRNKSFASEKTIENKEKPELCVVINRILVFDILAHCQDLLTHGDHIKADASSDIRISTFTMNRDEVTGKPRRRGEPRRVLTGAKFGDKFGDKFGAALMAENKVKIINMLGVAASNDISSAFDFK